MLIFAEFQSANFKNRGVNLLRGRQTKTVMTGSLHRLWLTSQTTANQYSVEEVESHI